MRQLLCLILVSCASVSESGESCFTDRDCKGDRVCDARLQACVDPAALSGDGGGPGSQRCVEAPAGQRYQLASNSLRLPTGITPYLLDIDGDGKPENQLKAVVGVFAGASFDLQGPIDRSVQSGEVVILLDLHAVDLASGCANLSLSLAQRPVVPPKYDGTDAFLVSGALQPAVLYGSIAQGKLGTILPKDQRGTLVQQIQLSVRLSMGTLPLTIYGVQVQGAVSPTGVMSGEIHGVIRRVDIDGQIIPAMAQMLTDQIHKSPASSGTATIIRIFEDTAGNEASRKKCAETPEKCCAPPANRATTCEINAEEVRTNALLSNVLAADVQVYKDGVWRPVAGGADKDAMSVGLGFTAVKARF